jgi:magnesium transporter
LMDSYLRTPFATLWGKRGFWMTILFVGGFLTTTAMARFEWLFQKMPALMLFVPLIISAGGNCGSQSATLITRALALGEIEPRDWFHVLWHEILMGASLGLMLGLVGFLRAWITPIDALEGLDPYRLAAVVAVGVAVVVLCGNLVGAILPLALKRLGFDPALMSNPVVASLVDVTGIVVYFVIAEAMLN